VNLGHCASLSCVVNHARLIAKTKRGAAFCRWCGDYVPLGPSNDTPEVCVEIRAALLASDKTCWTPEEIGGGFVAAEWKPGEHFSDAISEPEEMAGYLAQLIIEYDATHDTASEGSGT
jgi:hypothetical protein